MKVRDILRVKGTRVIKIREEQKIHEAIDALVEHNVGSLLVADEKENIVGILTERDILRANARHFDKLSAFKVQDIMTRDIFIGLIDESLDYVMDLMTEKHIRHLPIVDQDKVVGLISIGDVVKARSHVCEVEAHHLKEYIRGQYPS